MPKTEPTADAKLLAEKFDRLAAGDTMQHFSAEDASLVADALRRYVPTRLLDDGEVEKLARKVAMPKYMYDTEASRLYLASFFNQASIFISLSPVSNHAQRSEK